FRRVTHGTVILVDKIKRDAFEFCRNQQFSKQRKTFARVKDDPAVISTQLTFYQGQLVIIHLPVDGASQVATGRRPGFPAKQVVAVDSNGYLRLLDRLTV